MADANLFGVGLLAVSLEAARQGTAFSYAGEDRSGRCRLTLRNGRSAAATPTSSADRPLLHLRHLAYLTAAG